MQLFNNVSSVCSHFIQTCLDKNVGPEITGHYIKLPPRGEAGDYWNIVVSDPILDGATLQVLWVVVA